jgi:Uma2 family endonuclease
MATLIHDLIAERETTGSDRFDEVWEGAYMMTPLANDEHQQIANRIAYILQNLVEWPGLGDVRTPTNLSDREEGWEHNYRVPDVAVFLKAGKAKNHGTHWSGPADLLVEIISPGDKSREKLSFYAAIGVREVLLVDRDPWALELYELHDSTLQLMNRDTLEQPARISLAVLPLDLRLQPGATRPAIEVMHRGTPDRWLV